MVILILFNSKILTRRRFQEVAPSPSKFVKGDFRESDYESDYDARASLTKKLQTEAAGIKLSSEISASIDVQHRDNSLYS